MTYTRAWFLLLAAQKTKLIIIKPEWGLLGVKVCKGLGPMWATADGQVDSRWRVGLPGPLWAPGLVCPGLAYTWL